MPSICPLPATVGIWLELVKLSWILEYAEARIRAIHATPISLGQISPYSPLRVLFQAIFSMYSRRVTDSHGHVALNGLVLVLNSKYLYTRPLLLSTESSPSII